MILLAACLLQFSGAWFYPPSIGNELAHGGGKPLGTLFQYLLWLTITMCMVSHISTTRRVVFFAVMRLFIPFWLLGLASAMFGYDPITSMRFLIVWMAMAVAAVATGVEISADRAWRVLMRTMLILLLVSVMEAVLMPTHGLVRYNGGMVWRGMFLNKNQLGWFGSITMALCLSGRWKSDKWTVGGLFLLSLLCLIGSASKGALVVVVAAFFYMRLLTFADRRNLGAAPFATLVILLVLATIAIVSVAGETILSALGRDVTLTGRTVIWQVYFDDMLDGWLLGSGPGAYTGDYSNITGHLAAKLIRYGAIYTPHNMYLGAFGDVGLFGAIVYVVTLGYITVVEPMLTRTQGMRACAMVGFIIMVGGLVETHEIYNAGIGGFVLIFLRAVALKEKADSTVKKGAVR